MMQALLIIALSLSASSEKPVNAVPNPLHAKAKGRTVYTVPLIVFMDDISSSISKQWDKHHVIYMSNALLPHETLKKQFYIHFATSLPHVCKISYILLLVDIYAQHIYLCFI